MKEVLHKQTWRDGSGPEGPSGYPARGRKLASLLAILGLAGGFPSLVSGQESFAPIAAETYKPITRPPFPDRGPAGPQPLLPPEDTEDLLDDADFEAEPPDSIVPIAKGGSSGLSAPGVTAATTLTSFAGLTQLSFPTNTNPPDTTLAKSSLRVLEAVNSAVALYQTNGSLIQSKTLMSFFSALPGDGIMFDPRVLYDQIGPNKRLYVVAVQVNFEPRVSNIYLAVSRSSDPTNLEPANWCRYWIPGRRDEGTSWDSFADYPMLGVGADTLVLSDNQARFPPVTNFSFAVIRAFNKPSLSNNATTCPVATAYIFQPEPSMLNNLNIYSLQPVEHYTAPSTAPGFTNPVYLVSTASPPTTVYKVWAVRNVASGAATLTVSNATGGTYTFNNTPLAKQFDPGGITPISLDSRNWRIRQAAGRGNTIWAAHATVCNSTPGTPTESCVRVVRIDVTPGSGISSHSASVSAETTFGGGDDIFYWMPGIAVNSALQTAVVFQHSSASTYLSAAYSLKNNADAFYPVAQALTTGNCEQEQLLPGNSISRTGDFVGVQTNPNDQVNFWLAAERASNLGGGCWWDTRIMQVAP